MVQPQPARENENPEPEKKSKNRSKKRKKARTEEPAKSDTEKTGAGSPENAETTDTTGTTGTSTGTSTDATETHPTSDLHKAQMRISGSMCYSCLMALKKKLKTVDGVAFIKIDKPSPNLVQAYAPDVSSWADALLIYDLNKVALADLRSFMKTNGYVSYKVVDRVLDRPLESFKEEKL